MPARNPTRGEIWFVHFPTDPPGKGPRPVIVVSTDARNRSERFDTALVVPLSTSIHKLAPTHILLTAGETGLQADSAARAENITTVRRAQLLEPRTAARRITHTRICQLADAVRVAMDCLP